MKNKVIANRNRRIMAAVFLAAAVLFAGCKDSAKVEMQEGQAPLTLISGAFYVDESWERYENRMEDAMVIVNIQNQILLRNNKMPIDSEDFFWDWCERDSTALIEQENESSENPLSNVETAKTQLNGYPAYRLSYEKQDAASADMLSAEVCWIYINESYIHAQWSESPPAAGATGIGKEEWDAFLHTVHAADDTN